MAFLASLCHAATTYQLEENANFNRMMKVIGHPDIRLYALDGYGHAMSEPGYPLLVREVKARVKARQEAGTN